MLKKYIDLVFIGVSGYFAGWTLSDFNEVLQSLVLIVTLAGLIIRTIYRKKV